MVYVGKIEDAYLFKIDKIMYNIGPKVQNVLEIMSSEFHSEGENFLSQSFLKSVRVTKHFCSLV